MICQVCKEDHNKPTRKWCDRSQLEIQNDYLIAEIFRLREALEKIVNAKDTPEWGPYAYSAFIAREALKGEDK